MDQKKIALTYCTCASSLTQTQTNWQTNF